MNIPDSERIAKILEKQGHKLSQNEKEADLIVLNCCSVRQSAIDRVYAKVNKFGKSKKIILAGCILESDRKKLKNKVGEFWSPDKYFNCLPLRKEKNIAYIPIMTGCNNFCSYCVVPYTRGREKSRPAEKIIKEAEKIAKEGYREIMLLGQNVNSYCSKFQISNFKFPNNVSKFEIQNSKFYLINFSNLLSIINSIPGNFRLSFMTSHPKDMSDELIETIAKCEKVVPQIHLPIQSGSDEILRKMNREYTAKHYKSLIKKIRSAFRKYKKIVPEISTDIIVGFPGETKKNFEDTVKLCKEVRFSKAYVARYSPRFGTAAAKMKDNVSRDEKKRRWKILDNLINKKIKRG